MRLSLAACAILILSTTLLSGCWDMKSIQDLSYVSTIGFDFVNGEYIVYSQSLDMTNISKQQDSPGGIQQTPPVLSKATGKTVQNAIDNLLKNTQIPHFTGFVGTLLFHERVLKKGILPIFDAMNRFGLIRYTKWIFATNEPIDYILNTHSSIGVSPVISVLREPYDVYKQRSYIEPIQFYRFTSRFWEPSYTVLIPNLGVYRQSGKVGKNVSRLTINGVQTVYRGRWGGFFQSKDLLGLRWLNPRTKRAPLVLWEGKNPRAVLFVNHVKAKVEPLQTQADPRFRVTVSLQAFVREMFAETDIAFIKKAAKKEITEQIRGTFKKGIQRGRDLYSLEYALFQDDLQSWKRFARNPDKKLTADCLADVDVKLNLTTSGKMKLEWYDYPQDLLP